MTSSKQTQTTANMTTSSTEITPFEIDIPQADLDDLRGRLERTRWPDELPNAGANYGIPLSFTKEVVEYWLLLLHGWPSSFVDFLGMIGPLTDPSAHGGDPQDAFHVVVPSVPGFGFSGPTHDTGWDRARIARAFAELMRRLDYQRYGLHGGDIGSFVGREMGVQKPDGLVGIHLLSRITG